ncbi:MAG: hypothetical protein ACUBOA_09835 [Candidatus Loosdrechtia sp.]|uniref:hypothetical protein n=1 Tax=Candidatus Loosdrechtia sp. TaxID=3101272 RepID=UPI003A76E2C5|nr:MAG: hypothetical protein QY305_11545 [Candidatus Jettenia sp. AMX2]
MSLRGAKRRSNLTVMGEGIASGFAFAMTGTAGGDCFGKDHRNDKHTVIANVSKAIFQDQRDRFPVD